MTTSRMALATLDAASKLTRRLDRSLSGIKGISFSEYQMLSHLAAQARTGVTRVDLAASVGLTPSGVTRALKPLEKLGFVETIKDERDARRALARLTDAGAELVFDADGVVADLMDRIEIEPLTKDETTRFVSYLRELGNA